MSSAVVVMGFPNDLVNIVQSFLFNPKHKINKQIKFTCLAAQTDLFTLGKNKKMKDLPGFNTRVVRNIIDCVSIHHVAEKCENASKMSIRYWAPSVFTNV